MAVCQMGKPCCVLPGRGGDPSVRAKCYVINLDHASERWSWMKSQLEKTNLPFERISGVLGSEIPENILSSHRSGYSTPLLPNEVGCLLSHMRAWSRIAEGQDDVSIILEDDVHISPKFAELIEGMDFDLESPFILKIESTRMYYRVKKSPISSSSIYKAHSLLDKNFGTAAYIINKAAASKLLKVGDVSAVPVDWIVSCPQVTETLGIGLFQTMPSPCVQDRYTVMKPQGFGSEIGDRATEIGTRMPWMNIVRPIYRALYSLSLSLKGQEKVRSKFA